MGSSSRNRHSILHVVGTRPNFVKTAPVMEAMTELDDVEQTLVHTGQHYDETLSGRFFEQLGLPEPDVNLGVGSGSHAGQTAAVMLRLESVLEEVAPDWVFVPGDVNSTAAAALTAAKLQLPVAHVEAGLRSGDRSMPEELNRIVTDHLSDLHFTTEASADANLAREGIGPESVHFVGNVMIDALERLRPATDPAKLCGRLRLEPRTFVAVTLHRPRNVDREERLRAVLEALVRIAEARDLTVVFPMHPRTSSRIKQFGLERLAGRLRVTEPLGYVEFLGLMEAAAVVLTDSGGIQEETTVLGVPCVTLRPNTERPVTLTDGTNRLFDEDLSRLPDVVARRAREPRSATRPPLWDGRAAERITEVVGEILSDGGP